MTRERRPAAGRTKQCKDCRVLGVTTKRPAPFPGPRCASHHREVKLVRRREAHDRYLRATYNITRDQYDQILAAQGGCCYICQRATGAYKNLSVDHDHSCCPGPTSCGRCVRGLLCRPDNRDVLGHLRDDVSALQRAIDYLNNPPAKQLGWF